MTLGNNRLTHWLSGLFGCCAALCVNAQPFIISERHSGVYKLLAEQIASQYQGSDISPLIYHLDIPESKPAAQALESVDEVITIGSGAMRTLLEYKNLKVPSLSVLTTKENYLEMVAHNPDDSPLRSVIYLNQPLERIVSVGGQILGDRTQYIIFDNKRFEQQRDIIDSKVVTYAPILDNTVIKTIRRLDATQQLAIIALPSHAAFTPLTIKNALISAYKARIPIIGYSQSFTQAGALFSLHSNVKKLPDEVRLWRKTHSSIQRASRYYTVSVNQQIARSLDIELAPQWQKSDINLEVGQ